MAWGSVKTLHNFQLKRDATWPRHRKRWFEKGTNSNHLISAWWISTIWPEKSQESGDGWCVKPFPSDINPILLCWYFGKWQFCCFSTHVGFMVSNFFAFNPMMIPIDQTILLRRFETTNQSDIVHLWKIDGYWLVNNVNPLLDEPSFFDLLVNTVYSIPIKKCSSCPCDKTCVWLPPYHGLKPPMRRCHK